MKISTQTKIRHRNAINKSVFNLPLSSRRLLFLSLAQINSRKIIPAGNVFRIYASEYAQLCDIDPKTAYAQLAEAGQHLQSSSLQIPVDKILPPIPRIGDGLPTNKKKGNRTINTIPFQ